jgi:hypothetical protein
MALGGVRGLPVIVGPGAYVDLESGNGPDLWAGRYGMRPWRDA